MMSRLMLNLHRKADVGIFSEPDSDVGYTVNYNTDLDIVGPSITGSEFDEEVSKVRGNTRWQP